jgi:hypothetical protein
MTKKKKKDIKRPKEVSKEHRNIENAFIRT